MDLRFLFLSAYKVCSESNAPGEITSVRIILEAWLFQVFLRPFLCRFVRIGRSGLYTAERRRRAVFTADSGDPLLVIHEIALGQQEVCQLQLRLSETGKDPP